MIFRQLFDSGSSTYTYLLADARSKAAILIDPVFEQHARDRALVDELGLSLRYTLDTHVHADHITGSWLMKRALGSRIVLSGRYGAEEVDVPVDDGDVVQFGDYGVSVRATPGHTAGCLTFVTVNQDIAFTGDCLLIRGAGRADFQQGDATALYRSIREQIFTLPDSCLVHPAHDYAGRTVSTVGEEKAFNPRIGGQANETDFVEYMRSLALPHPKKIDIAVPANMRCGRPEQEPNDEQPHWGPVTISYAGIPRIDVEWVSQHTGALHLLDVRREGELTGDLGSIKGIQHIPLDQLRARTDEVPRDRPVVTICRSGRRSAQAALILRQAGLRDVANLDGGMLRWRELALP